jgi:hypothetical protein
MRREVEKAYHNNNLYNFECVECYAQILEVTKSYAGVDEVWLCINQDALISDAASVAECGKNLTIPARHGFERIYLTYRAPLHEGGKYLAEQIL